MPEVMFSVFPAKSVYPAVAADRTLNIKMYFGHLYASPTVYLINKINFTLTLP